MNYADELLDPNDEIIFAGHPAWRGLVAKRPLWVLIGVVLMVGGPLVEHFAHVDLPSRYGAGLGVLVLLALAVVVFFERIMTTYIVTSSEVQVRTGIWLFGRTNAAAELADVRAIHSQQSPLEFILRIGNIRVDTSAEDEAEYRLYGIPNADAVEREMRLAQRRQRAS